MSEQFINALKSVNKRIFDHPEGRLVEQGIIDSLDVMNLVSTLEVELDIELEPEDIQAENFESVDAIWTLVSKYLGGSNARI